VAALPRDREPLDTLLRVAPGAARAEEWATVLAAAGVRHRLVWSGEGWGLAVTARDAERAGAALDAYEDENRDEPARPAPAAALPGSRWLGVAVAALLLGFFLVTGPRAAWSPWFERGSATAARILDGEAWRVVTAITLHADLGHVLGNAAACAVLIPAVAAALGPGTGLWTLLLAAAGANALTALVYREGYSSVGASTLAFAAIGVLVAPAVAARRLGARSRRRFWVVAVASVLLLLMAGTGEGTDVLGHAFGLVTGAVCGVLVSAARRRPFSSTVEWTLAAAAMVLAVACWLVA